ncbi:MAG: DUF3168 domain-containing protein [Anaplasma sp.]
MMRVADFYAAVIEQLRLDNDISSMVSSIYEQAPTSAAIPYIHLHMYHSEYLETFGESALKLGLACHLFSHSIHETLETTEAIYGTLHGFFLKEKHVFTHKGCKVVIRKGHVLQSSTNFEVLINAHV